MKVEYIGIFDSVFVPAAHRHVKRREALEVEDELGASLCEQGDSWRAASGKPKVETPSPVAADDSGGTRTPEDE